VTRATRNDVATDTLEEGLVTASRRRHYSVRLDGGEVVECVLKGRGTTLACGDRVRIARAAGGGSIEEVLPRTTLFYRSDEFKEKLIAANVTQVVGVVAPDIAVDEELINRWIVGAEAQACRFVLAANKADKPDFDALLERLRPFAALGYPVVPLSARRDVAPLLPFLGGQRTALIGQSGMGKSTILNAVAPDAMRMDSLAIARMLVDVNVGRSEVIRIFSGLTPAKIVEVVNCLNVVEMMMALQKMRARRRPGNQAHVTN